MRYFSEMNYTCRDNNESITVSLRKIGLVYCNSSWWRRVSWKTGTEHNVTLWQEVKSGRLTIVDQLTKSLGRRD
ncbi:hypothetical protein AVEN_216330-1, partial [Araneus ventricosus]